MEGKLKMLSVKERAERISELEVNMRIEVHQLPPVEYSLNWRGPWAKRYEAGIVYGNAVYCECVDARNRALNMTFPFIRARLNLTFVFPKKRRRDKDNLLARFKPGLDGIVHAGLLMDDDAEHVEIGKVDILVDPQRAPLTVLDIEELDEIRKEEDED